MKYNIYRLKSGKSQGAWQLPLTEILIDRIKDNKKVGLRKLKFVPGTDSFWAEDLVGDLKPVQIWFENGRLIVPKADKIQNELLQIHPFFNVDYELFDKEAEAKQKLAGLRAKDEVINLIANSDSDKIIATAMAVFGTQALSWDESSCELQLREFAEANPLKLSNELNSKTYESKYLSALAFGKGLVRTNLGKTAIIWNNSTEGEILKLARGENGISKLGELLSKRTDESELLLQAIGEGLDKISMNIPKKEKSSDSDKDKEIAALKKQLAEASKEEPKEESGLSELQKEYKDKFEKDVPLRFKNDIDWIQNKLSE